MVPNLKKPEIARLWLDPLLVKTCAYAGVVLRNIEIITPPLSPLRR